MFFVHRERCFAIDGCRTDWKYHRNYNRIQTKSFILYQWKVWHCYPEICQPGLIFQQSAPDWSLELYPYFKSQSMIHESSWCHQVDGIKSLWSLSHGKPLTYLPWLELSGSLPIYPTIFNATTTRITWDLKRQKHKVYEFPARWKFIDANGTSNQTIERTYYQFCRDKVNSSNLGKSRLRIWISEQYEFQNFRDDFGRKQLVLQLYKSDTIFFESVTNISKILQHPSPTST